MRIGFVAWTRFAIVSASHWPVDDGATREVSNLNAERPGPELGVRSGLLHRELVTTSAAELVSA